MHTDETKPQRKTWLDVLLRARALPPREAGSVHLKRSEDTFELHLIQPKAVLVAITLGALAAVPQLRDLLAWAINQLGR